MEVISFKMIWFNPSFLAWGEVGQNIDRCIKPGEHQPQAGAPGFLKLILCELSVCVFVCVCVCVCVCPRLRLLITSGVIETSYDWLNKFYSCYMATVVVIVNGRGLFIGTHLRH